MAVRSNILYVSGTGANAALRIMSSAQLTKLKELAAYFYSQDPVETLTYAASNGNLSPTMTDRRYQAGAAVTGRVSSYASEADTPDISSIDETYDHVSRSRISSTDASEPNENATNNAFPCYWDGATKTIKAMTKQDFFDTIIGPTILDGLVGTGSVSALAAGTYTVLTNSSSIAGSPGTTIVSTNPIFVDKVANVSAYTAAGIPETLDQPTTNNSYYLHLITANKPTYEMPIFLRSDGAGVQEYTTATFEDMVDNYVRSATFGKSGYSITYEMGNTVSNQKGSNINDRYYSGSSASGYTTYLFNANDYRTQEFPNGSLATRETWRLGITTGVSYSVSASVSSVNEGGSVTFTVTTANVTPGSVPYTITGISAADLSSGSLTGNVTTTGTYSSATGTTSITLDNDATTEGTETITFTAGGASVTVTVNDTSQTVVETVSLQGTTTNPHLSTGFPITDGSIELGWRFYSNGDIASYDNDGSPQFVQANHDWVNVSPPSNNYWIRATVQQESNPASQSQASSPSPLNTWNALTSNRTFTFTDNRAAASYASAYVTWKIEIASDSAGSNILATGYYRNNYEGGA